MTNTSKYFKKKSKEITQDLLPAKSKVMYNYKFLIIGMVRIRVAFEIKSMKKLRCE